MQVPYLYLHGLVVLALLFPEGRDVVRAHIDSVHLQVDGGERGIVPLLPHGGRGRLRPEIVREGPKRACPRSE